MAAWAQEGLEEKVSKGGSEEIPLIQGKEQWLRFAGAGVKGYPTPKVRETQVRWQVLQESLLFCLFLLRWQIRRKTRRRRLLWLT